MFGIGAALGLLVAVLLWSAQLAWSTWWLRRFRFGPVEWLWRCVTYWTRQPFTRPRPGPATG